MAKEWILNMATNRWGLNKKESVGPVSKWIRECDPKDIKEWEKYYYNKLKEFLEQKGINIDPEVYIKDLGKKLYIKISEVIRAEIDEVKEEDCIQYIYNLIINRTYDGYITEKKTIYGQLQEVLGVDIKPAPDEWDRLYNIDFFIKINNKYIGLQIKPVTYEQTPEIYKWKNWLENKHKEFELKFGGKVFVIFSINENNKKTILNRDIIEVIKKEIHRLKEEL